MNIAVVIQEMFSKRPRAKLRPDFTCGLSPKERYERIAGLKTLIKEGAERQRLGKEANRLCRITEKRRDELIEQLGWNGCDWWLCDFTWQIQKTADILTVAHIMYGELRGKPHPKGLIHLRWGYKKLRGKVADMVDEVIVLQSKA